MWSIYYRDYTLGANHYVNLDPTFGTSPALLVRATTLFTYPPPSRPEYKVSATEIINLYYWGGPIQ